MYKVLHYGETNVGRERKNNEDTFRVASESGVFLVCDGMGGHASGEIASQIAADAMLRFLVMDRYRPGFQWPAESLLQSSEEGRALDAAVRFANREVLAQASAHPLHKGMGTTIVGILASAQRLGLVHVGDSRIYRFRNGELDQLTDDHSLLNHYIRTRPMSAQQIKQFAGKNVIVRAVGLRDMVEPDVQLVDYKHNDLFLLCSDGLTDMVEDEQIGEILTAHAGDTRAAGDALIQAALAGGGKDNVTVLLLQIQEVEDDEKTEPFGRQTQSMRANDTDVNDIPTDRDLARARGEELSAGDDMDAATEPALPLPILPRQMARTQPVKPLAGEGAAPRLGQAEGPAPAGEITERIPGAAQMLAWQAKEAQADSTADTLLLDDQETLPTAVDLSGRGPFKRTTRESPLAKASEDAAAVSASELSASELSASELSAGAVPKSEEL